MYSQTATIDLGPDDMAQILVRVTIPAGQSASVEGDATTYETTRLDYRAQMCGFADQSGELVQLSKVKEVYQAELAPGRIGMARPGETVTYTHVLTNTGNVTDTYSLYPASGFYAQGEIMLPSTGQVKLAPLMTETVVISVVANLEAASGLVDLTEAVALSQNGDGSASAVNRTTISPTHGTRYLALDGTDSLVNELVGGGLIDYADNNCTQPNLGACRTLQHLLSQASAGDTVKIAAGNYTSTYTTTHMGQVITQSLFINKPLTITGGFLTSAWDEDPPAHLEHGTTLDAGRAGRPIYVTSESGQVHLERLTLTQGDTTGFNPDAGGSLYNEGADLVLDTVDIHANDAAQGAGIYSAGGNVLIANSLLHANGNVETSSEGGGIYLSSGTLTALNNTFYNNQVSNTGGALYISGTLALTNTIIADHILVVRSMRTLAQAQTITCTGITPPVMLAVVIGSNSVVGDPALNTDLSLQFDSWARDKADSAAALSLLSLDYANNPRLIGEAVDIGAYEFAGDPALELGPNNEKSLLPGTVYTYTHTLTNTGNITDTFVLTVTGSSWLTGSQVAPQWVPQLGPGLTATVQVYIAVPVDAGGMEDVATVVATSQGAGQLTASATDTTFALFTPGVEISSGESGIITPTHPITYTHRVTNTGSGQDTYLVSTQAPVVGQSIIRPPSRSVMGRPAPCLCR